MPLVLPEDIPAYTFLKDRAFVMGQNRATSQDIRPQEILLINLMPTKIETENQILTLLANSPLQVNITLLTTASYTGKNTPQSHMQRFYTTFADIAGRKFDGAIITGAPIEHLDFEDVKYWAELRQIMDYLKTNCTSSLYLCWGAMAGLYHFHGVQKISFDKKLSGVYDHKICAKDLLLNGLDDVVKMPHSRYYGMDDEKILQLEKMGELKVLLQGRESGISVVRDEKDIFILGHPEYSRQTLAQEYARDLAKGLEIEKPANYFYKDVYFRKDPSISVESAQISESSVLDCEMFASNSEALAQNLQSIRAKIELECGTPLYTWRSSSSVLFSNWLNFMVYQITPFVL